MLYLIASRIPPGLLAGLLGMHLGLAEGSLGKTRTSWNGGWGVPGLPWGSLGGVLWLSGFPRGSLGGRRAGEPRGSLGLLGEGPGGTENTEGFLRVSGGVLGGLWRDFGCLGWSLGHTPGGANVDISLVLIVFLRSLFFSCFFCDF